MKAKHRRDHWRSWKNDDGDSNANVTGQLLKIAIKMMEGIWSKHGDGYGWDDGKGDRDLGGNSEGETGEGGKKCLLMNLWIFWVKMININWPKAIWIELEKENAWYTSRLSKYA